VFTNFFSYYFFVMLLGDVVLSPNDLSPVASGLRAELDVDGTAIETIPAASANPAMAYALLGLIGCLLNFALLVGVGVYCMRNKKRYDMSE
jgi:hypothetical protein